MKQKQPKKKVNLHDTFDARIWVEEWLRIIEKHPDIPTDEGTMLGWFANAIMAGYDHAHRESAKTLEPNDNQEVKQNYQENTEEPMSEITILPDGSAFFGASYPLPDDHWLFAGPESGEEPPMSMQMGIDDPRRSEMKEMLRQAGRYAVRAATSNGKIDDFDPDAIIQNLIVGMLGYNTSDGSNRDDDFAEQSNEARLES